MTEPTRQEAQLRATLGVEVNEALNILDVTERNLYLQMNSTMDPERVHPLLENAATRARTLRTQEAEVARLNAVLATRSIPAVPAGTATNEPRPTPINQFQLMDKESRRSLLHVLRPVTNYDVTIVDDAVRKWTRHCDRYFSDLNQLTGSQTPEVAKVVHARGKLVKAAAERLRVHTLTCDQNGEDHFFTWASFKIWIEREFSEHLTTEKLYERYDAMKQGSLPTQEYAANLRQVVADLGWNVPDPMLIQRFVAGAKPAYRAKWAEERDQPKSIEGVIARFAAYERGRTIARRHETSTRDPDAMDLSVN
ncbi:hypothetical protein N7475_001053 [Penicillium sp. IBT 31633x]|nr:hypothetical protein N7475_001053 [Penicillium sp. IBT 31633x]